MRCRRTRGRPTARRQAQRVKVFVGTTAYSLATNPNPEIAIIDLAVNISLQHAIFKGGLAKQYFGDAGEPLVKAYARTEEQAWATLARVFTPSQLSLLHDGIERWLADNPHTLQFVRVPALAKYRDVSPVTTPGSIRLMAPVAEAARTAMELRLLGERSLYLAERFPYLINWHTKQVLFDTLETPEFREMLHSTATFASSSERLAKVIDEMPDSELLRSSLSDLRATLTESVVAPPEFARRRYRNEPNHRRHRPGPRSLPNARAGGGRRAARAPIRRRAIHRADERARQDGRRNE